VLAISILSTTEMTMPFSYLLHIRTAPSWVHILVFNRDRDAGPGGLCRPRCDHVILVLLYLQTHTLLSLNPND
jgi:hypothetical protein